MLDTITDPLQHDFMRRAVVEVVLMGVATGLIGTYLVLRGLSLMGDALSHAIFPGVVIASLLDRSMFLGAIIFGIITSIGVAVLSRADRVREDSAAAVLLGGMFALGVILIGTGKGDADELVHLLFGDVLSVSRGDIVASALTCAVVLAVVLVFRKQFLAVSFDRTAAQAMGLPVFWLDVLLMVLIALTIVVSLKAVGNILVVSMLITPAATARLLTERLSRMMAFSAIQGVTAGVIGLYIAYYNDVSAGGAIALVSTAGFALAWLFAPTHGLVTSRLLRPVVLTPAAEAQVLIESPEIRSHNP